MDGTGKQDIDRGREQAMDSAPGTRWAQVLVSSRERVLASWLQLARVETTDRAATQDAGDLLDLLGQALGGSNKDDVEGAGFAPLRQAVGDMSARRGRAGSTPVATASFVLALREALLTVADSTGGPTALADVRWLARLVDRLALLTLESYVQGRQDVISQQGQQLLELSTPVVRLWDRVVAAPLVGTLDSARAQVVMETLLEAIVEENALVAILDITGVPTVDTLVAQHLLKTVAATRLMGAECIVSGIRPQTAQTIVQLGIDLTEVITRTSLADALSAAIERVQARDARVISG